MSLPRLSPVQKCISPPALHKEMDLNTSEFFQEGRRYTLTGGNIPHQLPAPDKLRPFMDRKAGNVETWPASKDTVTAQAKPKLLQKLESYLQKELKALGCQNDAKPSEKRMQPYREVFDYVIENFRTYKPLLSAIKLEYETMMGDQKETIKKLEPLKAMLVNMNEQCEQKILGIKNNEKQELVDMRNENTRLEKTITSLKEEIESLQIQVKKCQKEIGIEYKKYRDELDARKLLIQDINDMRYQQEELKKALSGNAGKEGEQKEDAVILKIALTKAREELSSKTQRLTEVLSDYGDVVPRREFEALERQFKALGEEHAEMKKNNNQLLKEHSALIDVHKKVIEQRDGFAMDCERMRQSATPRPDWNKCGLYVEGGFERWNNLADNTSTNEKLDLLLSEMTGQDVSVIKAGGGIVDYFEPKGVDESIPKYLHSNERVRNRRLNKRDLLIMIKDVWMEKTKEEGHEPFTKDRANMADYLFTYLRQRFGVDAMVTEWGYNLHDAMVRYSFDSNVAQFSSILNNELDEDVHFMQLKRLENMFKALVQKDASETGSLSKENFQTILKAHFHFVSDDVITKMVDAAAEELGGEKEDGQILYKDLFTEDDEGRMGAFVKLILQTYEDDKAEMIRHIEATFEKKSEINSNELKTAFLDFYPKLGKSKKAAETMITMAFKDGNYNGTEKSIILRNLQTSCIGRS